MSRTDQGPRRSRRYARIAVPAGVAAVAALAASLGPALADSGGPSLTHLTAKQLLEKMAAARGGTEAFSGTVTSTPDLGLPQIPSGLGGAAGSSSTPSGGAGGKASSSAADPQKHLMGLLTGDSTMQVAVDGPKKSSVALVESLAEYRVVRNGDSVWAYDSSSNTAWHRTLSGAEQKQMQQKKAATPSPEATTPSAVADRLLAAAGPSTSVNADGTTTVAGRDAYVLDLTPKNTGSTIGDVKIAVDAQKYVPLRVTVDPASGGKAAWQVGFTSISFGTPPASRFAFTPPSGAKVTTATPKAKAGARPEHTMTPQQKAKAKAHAKQNSANRKTFGSGWATVYRMQGASGSAGTNGEMQKALSAMGSKVSGSFGSGTLVKSRLINVLVTDSGKVYAGAVPSSTLISDANADR
ncbi:hypothetical protein BIV57_02805 [Mangrovactinospora gilvigrisea]|uniref:DUF2092 domain-containing protein n=1 Tax=Mangrovactinospora gilvigrisea TaxID=1428644 RepID=A0A1J7CHD6_9ACTN|nr:outer membrane lipoprotein carrier protein LolA [Mangrovactinospora gilvigrisea]OIV39050.1 hypothetical protein BIV57_02805 [Mangrovactinospora gilvigrisea]